LELLRLTPEILAELPKSGDTDPLEYYRRPLVGKFYLNRINRSFEMLPSGNLGKVLEVGYGAGAVQLALAAFASELHGIDLDADPNVLAKFFGNRAIRPQLIRGSVLDLPYSSEYFDLVVCFSVLEHIQDYVQALREIHRVLIPNGHFLLGMPTVNRLMDAAFLAIGFRGIDDLHITRPVDVAQSFGAIGFKCNKQNPLDFPFRMPFGVRLYHSWLLQKS
jgi:SAM-dependent methyltransferase